MSDESASQLIAGAAVLDRSALERLERVGGPSLLHRMIDIFLQDAAPRMDTILQSREPPEVMRAAHTLRSSAGNLGLDQVFRLTEVIETRAAAGDEAGYLPLRAVLAQAYARAVAALGEEMQPAAPAAGGRGGTKRIALVEDNPDNRLLVQAILEDLYDVVEYESGEAALLGMHAQRPDLVLLDISLPEMDGTQVLRAMRRDDALRVLPVIALTAHAMAGDREKYLDAGFDEYLTKPIVDESLLLDAIRRLLEQRSTDG